MAVLIVDDEANTREALRNLLERLGYSPIVEAKNGQEALKTALSAPARVDMIIADWEMPYMDGLQLLKEVAKARPLDLVPFLLITSDLSDSVLSEFHRENPRLDHHLLKPFRLSGLSDAMDAAARGRAETRDGLLLIAPKEAPAGMVLASVIRKKTAGHWKTFVHVNTSAEAEVELAARGALIGAVMLDPELASTSDTSWISAFKKTPLGSATEFVGLSREPIAIRQIRTHCQFFIDVPAANEAAWGDLMKKLSRTVENAWPVGRVLREMRALIQRQDYKAARKHFTQLFKLDDFSSETHLTAGEVCEGLGDIEGACRQYRYAAEANPCIPRSHIKMLALDSEPARLAETAVQFCPGNVDVLTAAARAWKQAAEFDRAREAAHQALVISPGHKAAREILEGLK